MKKMAPNASARSPADLLEHAYSTHKVRYIISLRLDFNIHERFSSESILIIT